MAFIAMNQLEARDVEALWPSRLLLGQLHMIDGDPGIGKSLVMLDLCARITTGRPFPDGAALAGPASVMVMNAEDGPRDVIRGRLLAAGADLSRVIVWDREPGEAWLRLPSQCRLLEERLAESGARLVVIDPLLAFLDSAVNICSDQSVRQALAPLADLAQRHRCAIALIRHLTKERGGRALYRGLASIGFIAVCRLAWLLGPDPKLSGQYVLAAQKSNLDAPPSSLSYRIASRAAGEAATIHWLGASPCCEEELLKGVSARRRTRCRAMAFLTALLQDGPRSTRQVSEAARGHRLHPRTLQRAAKELQIRFRRVASGTPQQTNLWLLPGQEVPGSEDDIIEEYLRKMEEQFAQDKLEQLIDGRRIA